MLPKTILHNSISLDGSLTNFDVNMELHYKIAGSFKPNSHLIGSNTIKTGLELYGEARKEEKKDFKKPARAVNLPYWVIIDSKGILKGQLHEVRRFEFCKDVVIIISKKTPKSYIDYLKKRNYDFHIIGSKHVDLKKALELLYNKYETKILLTDCGKILGNILISKGLVNEISLLIHPIIIGKKSYDIFGNIEKIKKLELLKNEVIDENYIWQLFRILY
jgi:2,5-diamino-6-(ribosylamino)-4(3H)-pyrimidinone 5'-phosphate reductase